MESYSSDLSDIASHQESGSSLKEALDLIYLHLTAVSKKPDKLPGNQEEQDRIGQILEIIDSALAHTLEISEGKLHSSIILRGVFGGALKNLQSNLRHLTWKTQMIAKGDFSQRIDFLYDFSEAFNKMVRELDETKKALDVQTDELNRTIASLSTSKEQYKSLIQQSPISVCVLKKGKIILANSACNELLHIGCTEQIDGSSFLRFVSPENRSSFLDKITRSIEYSGHWSRFEEEIIRDDKTAIVAEITGTEIVFDNEPVTLILISDITDKKRQEERILSDLQEKDVLLREVYHRVKNNMQIIWSLLSMQAKMVDDKTVKGYFTDSQNRVKSLALVHELLYKTDNLREVQYGQYLEQFTSYLSDAYNLNRNRVRVMIEAGDESMTLAKAVPCSLILNELITNSLKYAFKPDEGGSISIIFQISDDHKYYIIEYRDTGSGIPESVQEENNTLGMRLIYGLARQLNGDVSYENDCGVHYVITFPVL